MSSAPIGQAEARRRLIQALCDDIVETPSEQLLAEVAEDYGDPRVLAREFDELLEKAEPADSPSGDAVIRASASRHRLWQNRVLWEAAAAVLLVAVLAATTYYLMQLREPTDFRTAFLGIEPAPPVTVAQERSRPTAVLPRTGIAEPDGNKKIALAADLIERVYVTIKSDMTFVLNDKVVARDQLGTAVKAASASTQPEIVLTVDASVSYGELVAVVKLLRSDGLDDIVLREPN